MDNMDGTEKKEEGDWSFAGFPTFEDWLDDVRIKIYEREKDMTTEEIVRLGNERGRKTAEEYGLKPAIEGVLTKERISRMCAEREYEIRMRDAGQTFPS